MATRTKSRKRSAPSKRRPATKKSPSRRAPAEPRLRTRASEAARRELGGHGPDAAAVGLLVLAALLTLGLLGDLAGPIGGGLADGVETLIGRAAAALPVVLVVFAVLLFSIRPTQKRALEAEEEGEEPPPEPMPVRVAVGFALIFVASVGFLHLAFDTPSVDGPMGALRDAGGVLGAVFGGSLDAAAGVVGAAIVLSGVALLGVLLAPGVPMRDVMSGVGRGARWAGGQARVGAQRLGTLADPDGDEIDRRDRI